MNRMIAAFAGAAASSGVAGHHAVFIPSAGDSRGDGVIWGYRYKGGGQ
jgi:hypothetical protein